MTSYDDQELAYAMARELVARREWELRRTEVALLEERRGADPFYLAAMALRDQFRATREPGLRRKMVQDKVASLASPAGENCCKRVTVTCCKRIAAH